MKRILPAIVVCYLIAASGCRGKAAGKIELYDKSAVNLIDTNAEIEVIGRNYKWSEGPVWVAAKQMLLFSDVIGNKVYRWSGNDTPVVYLTPSGYTDSVPRDGENGSNGLTLDRDGRLLLCQSGNRQVVRMDAALDAPVPKFTVLSSGYQGKRFNSPNDLVTDRRNHIYFTDPIYGLPKQANDPTRELKFEGVYRISPEGETVLLIDSISRPNGIALSPDEKTLYVGSSDDQHPKWYAYQLDTAGNIQGGGVLLDGTEMKARASVKQGADGFKVDGHGNIFSSGPDGVVIISPGGKVLGLIRIFGRPASNCAFNEKQDVLYITADDVVLRVKLH
jgi:gluconolactonase